MGKKNKWGPRKAELFGEKEEPPVTRSGGEQTAQVKRASSDVMTAKQLHQYQALCSEIKELEEMIENEKNVGVVTDVVSGSDSGYPYIKRKFTITGIDTGREDKLRRMKEKCCRERDAILDYINDIEESRLRQIFMLRHLDGLSWRAVAFRLGGYETEDGVRMKHDRYLRKNKKI